MYDEPNLLTDTFESHAHLAPEASEVLANVDAIARSYRRNRWVVRATGISLVSAGIVAGSVALPGLISGSSSDRPATVFAPAADGTNGTYTQAQEISEYLTSGYDYNNALELAKLWHMPTTAINKVKAKAGLELLQGQTLPVTPNGAPATPEDKAVATFFAAGYDYNDAVTLASMWHDKDTYQAKVQGGTKLENGETLPIQPSGDNSPVTPASIPTGALTKAETAKVLAARKMRGLVFSAKQPATPVSAAEASQEAAALSAYFKAGYDYNDAVKLGQMWHESNIYQAKVEAGQKLENGETLPISPGS